MKIWLDAQLSPAMAEWIIANLIFLFFRSATLDYVMLPTLTFSLLLKNKM